MEMEKFKAQLKELAGKDGEKAWKIVEDWYTKDGRARRLSLHDLHDLSKDIVLYTDEIRWECEEKVEGVLTKLGVHKDAGIRRAISTAIMGRSD